MYYVGADHPQEGALWEEAHTWACADLPAVDILNFIRYRAAAMRAVSGYQFTAATCSSYSNNISF